MKTIKELERKIKEEAEIRAGEFVELHKKELRKLLYEELVAFANSILRIREE